MWHDRRTLHEQPFEVSWIPAHCFEHLPIDAITEDMAIRRGTTVKHIQRNRLVDSVAKEFAATLSPVEPAVQHAAAGYILQHHAWLAKLHALLPTDDGIKPVPEQATESSLTLESCRTKFPQWAWNANKGNYPWKVKIPTGLVKPPKWDGSTREWESICCFLQSLRWRADDDGVTSLCELTVSFCSQRRRFDEDPELAAYFSYHKKLRSAVALLSKMEDVQIFPGQLDPALAKAAGRTMPQGAIRGAALCATNDCLHHLGCVFAAGAGRTLASWNFCLL